MSAPTRNHDLEFYKFEMMNDDKVYLCKMILFMI